MEKMRDARLLLAVYACAEDARAAGVSTKKMWDTDYKDKYNQEYDEDQLHIIMNVVNTSIDMVNDLSVNVKDINKEIAEIENKLSITILTRINFMIQNDILFNVIKGKNDMSYTVTYTKEAAAVYLAFLKSIMNRVQ